ncbi:GGDEF domain-containing protein [Legionella pneumophila serogroup 1]|uniref:Cyclic di-GMP phosphodiesterase Gmr n=1 Tax=Fluoribacter dumoffii TaxID=463 RepID=A0A377GBH7_9GAMM|nr:MULTISPECIES: GGDEF domain-containing protein [Legionellaceae]KTC92803.1 Diguanylate kinase [Fluoribacter dumoffii NY 23]MDW9174424.1 GGDEF domain-containing protein [Legionella pneumophila]SNV18406.1 Diguanylate kinase [Legionella pneumophila]STO22094.1 Cyclic di-GMP phosphodiesterase Gmr [Fluoribacter dumoffii]HAT4425585.1 GGDEF domain-containing protein [Legionella pneumophila]
MVFPVVMIVLGIVFLISGAYLVNRLLQQTSHYRMQWLGYLAFIGAFILSYSASIFYGLLVDPHCLNYFYASVFLLGATYVYLSCRLMTKTIQKMELMDDFKNRYEILRHHATYDSLTGCNNREYLFEILNTRFQQIKMNAGSVIVLFIDMDRFKTVNDRYGHEVGDTTLQMFGGLLRQRLRRDDLVARYGGDEFIVLMENTSMDEAKKIAENLITVTRKSFKEGTLSELNLGCSIGITQMNHHSASVNTVIKEADLACYAAKQRKINGSVCVYSPMLATKNNAIHFSRNQITQ